MGAWKSATTAPDPLLLPPGVRWESCGFAQSVPTGVAANSVVFVLPDQTILGQFTGHILDLPRKPMHLI